VEKTMTRQLFVGTAVLVGLLLSGTPGAAQQSLSSTDIQRLQDQAYQVGRDVSQIRSSNPDLASRLEGELDDLRDEIVYLKVKLRKEGSVTRSEYADLRDRLQDLRSKARGDVTRSSGDQEGVSSGVGGGVSGGASGGVSGEERRSPSSSTGRNGIPAGHEIDVRLEKELTSDTAQVEDRFEATTVADVYQGNDVLIPAGSQLRGIVSSVNRASRTDRKGSLTVSFDQITVRGRTYPMRGTVTQALESEGMRGEVGRIGAGAGVGAIIGGIIGGVKGALLGVLIGGGGTIAATEGKDVTLPPGTILRVRLDQPPSIRQ
jgi:outer membrane murein-binding lipoprotein Lpp